MNNIFCNFMNCVLIGITSASPPASASEVSNRDWFHKFCLQNTKKGSVTYSLPNQFDTERLDVLPVKFKLCGVEYSVWVSILEEYQDLFFVVTVTLTTSIPAEPYFADIESFDSCVLDSKDRPWWNISKSKCKISHSIHRGQSEWNDNQENLLHIYANTDIKTWDQFKSIMNSKLMVTFSVKRK